MPSESAPVGARPAMDVSIQPLFATPMVMFRIGEHPRLNVELSRLILEREASHAPHADHEVVGWSSHHDLSMLEWAGAPLKGVLDPVVDIAGHMTELLDRPGHEETRLEWQVAEVWANVQRKGGSNAAHAHPGSFWSGVYYVDAGEIPHGRRGGELWMFDPRGCLPRMLAPYLRYSLHELHDAGTSISVTPVAGQCLLFPGWLFHAVSAYTGNSPRISIAFNLDPTVKSSKEDRRSCASEDPFHHTSHRREDADAD